MRPDLLLALAPPETYFEWGTLVTYAGATASAFAVGAVIGAITGETKIRTLTALIWSLAVMFFLAWKSVDPGGEKWFVAIANAFLVTASALGLNTAAGGQGEGGEGGRVAPSPNRLIGPWW
jgi:hypothetical protein